MIGIVNEMSDLCAEERLSLFKWCTEQTFGYLDVCQAKPYMEILNER